MGFGVLHGARVIYIIWNLILTCNLISVNFEFSQFGLSRVEAERKPSSELLSGQIPSCNSKGYQP